MPSRTSLAQGLVKGKRASRLTPSIKLNNKVVSKMKGINQTIGKKETGSPKGTPASLIQFQTEKYDQ